MDSHWIWRWDVKWSDLHWIDGELIMVVLSWRRSYWRSSTLANLDRGYQTTSEFVVSIQLQYVPWRADHHSYNRWANVTTFLIFAISMIPLGVS